MPKISGYRFQDSHLKTIMRSEVLKQVCMNFDDEKAKLNCLTLPSDTMIFEQLLYDEYKDKVHMTGVERNKKIFENAKRKAAALDLPLDMFKGQLHKFLKKYNGAPYDLVWADYCGPWCSSVESTLYGLAQGENLNVTKKTSPIVAMTIQNCMDMQLLGSIIRKGTKRQEGVKNKLTREEYNYQIRLSQIPLDINAAANRNGNTAVPLMTYYYRDSIRDTKAIPMLLYLFEVQQGVHEYDINEQSVTELVTRKIGDINKALKKTKR